MIVSTDEGSELLEAESEDKDEGEDEDRSERTDQVGLERISCTDDDDDDGLVDNVAA